MYAKSRLYWTAEVGPAPPNMKKYHLFVDGVNPAWGQNGIDNKKTMKLSHDGLTLCLYYGEIGPTICHEVTNIPSTLNSTIDYHFKPGTDKFHECFEGVS